MSHRRIRLFAVLTLALACLSGHAETIKVVTEDSSYTYLRSGKVAGPATEIVETTMQRAGITDYKVALYPWARAYDMAQQEPNVLIFLIARTSMREPLFKWAGEFMRIEYHLYKLRERKDITVRDLNEAKGYTIGVMRDDVRQAYLQTHGFTRLAVSAQNADNFRKLLNQQVQLVPMPESDMLQFCEEAKIDPNTLEKVFTLDEMTTGIYMAYSKATPDDTVNKTRAAFDKLKAEGLVSKLMQGARR